MTPRIPVPEDPTGDPVAELWTEYKRHHTSDARERLILHYAPLVKFVAGRVASGLPQSVEQADLVSYGIFDPVEAFEVDEMKVLLAEAANRVPERERLVLTLYYYEGLTLSEIGDVLGVTESRACQIPTKGILQLRARLGAPESGRVR